ncbi:formimidoyltetrahydrofolate cyclodeaminase [Conexibacter woesei]|uniref:glutamate formimidoyltransferase n=1 Tax=Conexibacter woesei (strain DSM 14684 / CCUG 47730 / CIP 108061 / JCM 11494 / NBRC 100937 / ID131577) TaxID=469383 RepID=D3FCR8_CONWI|nr:formimidoyltetrahydrofolate cyclodeaminase [Conexibacter woesei]ADB51430.1 Formimidoyltetrahydrofolate cyclodeaminase [Conexibacter woesei DSM 14684]
MGPLSDAADAAPVLLAVPNVSEGRDDDAIDAIAAAFTGGDGVRLLDVHRDPDHNRSVVTLAGAPGALAPALAAGAREAIARIDLRANDGVHPHVGALDVAPVVHLTPDDRGAACAEALLAADLLARLGLPVLLYGALAQGRTRAQLRRGGPAALAARLADGELATDFGPPRPHPTAGTTLVAARPPLVAFNVVLRPPVTLEQARAIAAAIREGGDAELPGLRAIGLQLERAGEIQLSMNVERPDLTPLRDVVAAIAARAPIARAELVALAPEQAFAGFPADLPIPGFDPARHLIERALRAGS